MSSNKISIKPSLPLPNEPSYSLESYTGNWEYQQAAHLLRRTTFGATYTQIKAATAQGLEATINELFDATEPLPEPPLNYRYEQDPNVPIGETWINALYIEEMNLQGYRRNSLAAWNTGVLLNAGLTIREKMTLFWHNHFVVQASTVRDPKYLYQYILTLRENATGNFKDLVKKMTLDPAMLRYLNGNSNTKNKPNENFARELLELFTLGKGELAGPGDYTTFTEQDVIEGAKILTGWRDRGYRSKDNSEIYVEFKRGRHNRGNKQLSHRFGNALIYNADEAEYHQFIDLIFEQEAAAKFICRKLYRWFVYYKIDEQVEQQIITPLAELLVDNDFEITPVIQRLLQSEHFYDVELIGPMIKNPLDFMIGLLRQFELAVPKDDVNKKYRVWNTLNKILPNLQMVYFEPPDVAGWKAYYQEPGYYQVWISAVTLTARMQLTDLLALEGRRASGVPIRLNVLSFIQTIEDSLDPNVVIETFAKIFFTQPLSEQQHLYLKEILIPGLPDYEWTVEYSDYLSNPTDKDLQQGVENRLRMLIKTMLTMPEYYLM